MEKLNAGLMRKHMDGDKDFFALGKAMHTKADNLADAARKGDRDKALSENEKGDRIILCIIIPVPPSKSGRIIQPVIKVAIPDLFFDVCAVPGSHKLLSG